MTYPDTADTLNGQREIMPIRVRFGPRPSQDMPLPWAEFMLNEMRQAQADNRKPASFGTLLARAAMETGQ